MMKATTIGKLIALAIATLGLIHNLATFTPIIKGVLQSLPKEEFKFMLYANLMCGSFFIISGILLLIFLNKIEDYPFLISPILLIGFFLLLSGVLLLYFSENIFDNPFAVISIVLNFGIFAVIINIFYRIKFPSTPKKWYNYLG
jgi:hypothetical protein